MFRAVVLRFLALGFALFATQAFGAPHLWIAAPESLRYIDGETAAVSSPIRIAGIELIAPDGAGNVWVLAKGNLLRYDGVAKNKSVSLATIGLAGRPKLLRVDPQDQSLWIASEDALAHIDANGKRLARRALSERITDLSILPDQSLWVLGENYLWHFAPKAGEIELLESVSVASLQLSEKPKVLLHDPARNRLWLGGETTLYRLQQSGPAKAFDLARPAFAFVVDTKNDWLLVLHADAITVYSNASGSPQNIDLRQYGIRDAAAMVQDSGTGNLWVRHGKGISRLNPHTGVVFDVPNTESVTLLEHAPLSLRPAIALVQPAAESEISTQSETFVLRMDGRCYGAVCAPASYAKRLHLDAALGNERVGDSFKLDIATGLTSYTAFNLPEGKLPFNAQATDTYGQESNKLATYFIARNTASAGGDVANTSTSNPSVSPDGSNPPPIGAVLREVEYGAKARAGGSSEARAEQNFLSLPLQFTRNNGQYEEGVKFKSRGLGYSLKLSADRATLAFTSRKNPLLKDSVKPKFRAEASDTSASLSNQPVDIRFPGANSSAKVSGLDELPGRSHFYRGKDSKAWRTNVPNYARVRYENVYPGIDKIYYGNQSQIEYDWIVAAGADPTAIRQVFDGATSLSLDTNGDLLVQTTSGLIRQKKPYAYQEQKGLKTEVQAEYRIADNGEVRFQVGGYDKARTLVIDPVIYGYTRQLGGTGWDNIAGIRVDKDGNAYIAATMQVGSSNNDDIVVYKISADGNAILYTTVLGGSWWEQAAGLAVNSAGEVYVAGNTSSHDFPATGIQKELWGQSDAVVARLNAGGQLVWATYYGGGKADNATAITLDNNGAPYIAGWTESSNFPRRSPVPTTYKDFRDGFVVKLTAGGARVYSGYIGGTSEDNLTSIAVDATGHVHVAGYTKSSDLQRNWPYRSRSGFDGFYGKLNIVQGVWAYHGYLAGFGDDRAYDVQVDSAGAAYVVGETTSNDFTVAAAYQPRLNGPSDGFITKVDASGVVVYSTYLGGEDRDALTAVAVDTYKQPHVAGYSLSPSFPGIRMERDPAHTAVVAKLNVLGNAFIFAGSLPSMLSGEAIALDRQGNTYVAGAGGLVPGRTIGGESVYVAKLLPPNDAITLSSSRNPVVEGRPVTFIATVSGNKPNGPVTFKNGSGTLGIVGVTGGVASLTTTLPQGTHAITARFSGDARNPAQTSPVLSQVVLVSGTPSVALTAPAPNSTWSQGAPVPFTIQSMVPAGRTVRSVGIRVDNVYQAVDPPALIANGQLTALNLGNRILIAVVEDSVGDVAESAPVMITIIAGPRVTLTAPQIGAEFTAPAAMVLTASPQASTGRTITKVDFYQNDALIQTRTEAPYEIVWKDVPVGQYTLTAKVTDSGGATGTSPPIAINVAPFGGPKVVYLHTDFSGSPVAATDPSGAVLWKEAYRPFGIRQKSETAAKNQDQWFHGKEQDETGLQYFGARYYDPQLGRFTGIDPVGVKPADIYSFNRYAYGNNNPYKYLDPDGRSAFALPIRGLAETVRIFLPRIAVGGGGDGVVGGILAGLAASRRSAAETMADPERRASVVNISNKGRKVLGLDPIIWNENTGQAETPDEKATSDAIQDITEGLPNETDKKGRPVKGHYVNGTGDAQKDLDSLPGTVESNGQKTLPDGSVAGTHTSTSTGATTLHINRPWGHQDIKIRYP